MSLDSYNIFIALVFVSQVSLKKLIEFIFRKFIKYERRLVKNTHKTFIELRTATDIGIKDTLTEFYNIRIFIFWKINFSFHILLLRNILLGKFYFNEIECSKVYRIENCRSAMIACNQVILPLEKSINLMHNYRATFLLSGVNFTNILWKVLHAKIPKVQKIKSSHQSFLRFWDLHK